MIKGKVREKLGYILGADGVLNRGTGAPFYRVRLDRQAAEALAAQLDQAATHERAWFTITVTEDNLNRLKIMEAQTPAFEMSAPSGYVRGSILRVSGQKSLNVDFSGSVGAGLLARQLRGACDRMHAFVEFRVPGRRRDLVVFIPDVDLVSPADEFERLGIAGVELANQVWPPDDFSDWEALGV